MKVHRGHERRVDVGIALAMALFMGAACSKSGSASKSPEQVVAAYLEAMKGGAYSSAYDHLMPHMVRDQGKVAWVAEQTALMNIADVRIESFEVLPARIQGDEAVVPNLLISKDRYINQNGAPEFELYTLVKSEGGAWKIRLQQLVESDAVDKWFPESMRAKR